jgi:hypothetical protein
MCRIAVAALIFSVLLGDLTHGQVEIPSKYEIVQLTENGYREDLPAINNHGQIVFERRVGPYAEDDEIFLYDDGEFMQLTDDDVQDMCPHINDDGTIVWSRRVGGDDIYGPTLEVFVWQDGELTRLTYDDCNDYVGGINNLGHIAWSKIVRGGCHNVNAVICFYDGAMVEQISDADWSNASPAINDQDWVAWTRYDFCQEPWWDSEIMLRIPGAEPEVITPPETYAPVAPTINNAGQVAWQFDHGRGDKGIELWEGGVTTLLTPWGGGPHLNDHGHVCFFRWYDDGDTYQMWLYRKGEFYQLSDDPFWNIDGDINKAGEVVWISGEYPGLDIRLLCVAPPDGADADTKLEASGVRRVYP